MAETSTMVETVENKGSEGLGDYIIHHIQDSHEWNVFGYHIHLPTFKPVYLFGIEFDFSITQHLLMMWIVRDVGDVSTEVSIPHLRVFCGCPGSKEPPGNHMR